MLQVIPTKFCPETGQPLCGKSLNQVVYCDLRIDEDGLYGWNGVQWTYLGTGPIVEERVGPAGVAWKIAETGQKVHRVRFDPKATYRYDIEKGWELRNPYYNEPHRKGDDQ